MPYLNKTQRVQAIVHFNEPQFKNVPFKYKVVAESLAQKFQIKYSARSLQNLIKRYDETGN